MMNDPAIQFPPALYRFGSQLEVLAEQLGGGTALGFAQIAFSLKVLLHERESRKAVEMARTAASLCSNMCPSAECLVRMGELARAIRDNYVKILSLLPWPMTILRGVIEGSLYAWDDLAEDCAVGSDPEIRETILKIADRL